MQPILFSIFGIGIASWYFFFALAGVAAFFYADALARATRNEVIRNAVPSLFMVIYVSGWFGARMLSIFNDQPEVTTMMGILRELFSLGPMTFYGGAIAGGLSGLVFVLLKGSPTGILFDIALPVALLALGIGRIGCFLNGCDYGLPVPLEPNQTPPWWSVVMPNLSDGISRYPTQLEESIFSIAVALVAGLIFVYKYRARRSIPGLLGASLMAITAAHRFWNETLRGDERGQFLGTSLSLSQGISLSLIAGSAAIFGIIMWKHRLSKE